MSTLDPELRILQEGILRRLGMKEQGEKKKFTTYTKNHHSILMKWIANLLGAHDWFDGNVLPDEDIRKVDKYMFCYMSTLINKIVDGQKIHYSVFQLLGCGAFMVALHHIGGEDWRLLCMGGQYATLSYMTDKAYTEEEIYAMEMYIHHKFNFFPYVEIKELPAIKEVIDEVFVINIEEETGKEERDKMWAMAQILTRDWWVKEREKAAKMRKEKAAEEA